MTSRNWVKLFLSTLLVGGLTTGVVGFIVRWKEFESIFVPFDFLEVLSVLLWLIGVGLIFSILSQMGFFAYLTIHRFGLGIFKSRSLWNAVQVFLIFFVLFDLVYFRYTAFAKEGESIMPYIGIALFLLAVAIFVAFIKVKQTNKDAFIPAVFFMVVVTTIEWVPVLRVNEQSWVFLMIFPLLVCNAYQLLILHKLNEKSQIHRQRISSKKPSK
ncbi:KinB-signaling pathway activation protein [Bacillus sp. DTU_2020_1000418_1_SI_GHA_SEK_038]|uniref:KinB-signaling pathway activation protein n=1 Tax=Bacillus sp. DTU_2020_1000418_1_SI_GHA_SEK_038 TaxID=3077585 RepID=UPI0028EA0875|nr:KinB-signaling pathway activation protein [Bacillus sp. DTU_2020_1000418_1_SI_GHA_SEK_038]WNS75647.1 KinB-signaling pathway activation protein [Bacillus sp. DTU_2020_1000418_1_SI_GHA_SEK_038]